MKEPSENLLYCCEFLRNAGERLRAIRLYHEFTRCGVKAAMQKVDSLKTPTALGHPRKPDKYCPPCNSVWHPDTQTCPHCGGPVDTREPVYGKRL